MSDNLRKNTDMMVANDLKIGYKNNIILSELNLELKAGEMVALIGENGSGKSTLIRTLCGLQPSLGGKIIIDADKKQNIAVVLTSPVYAPSFTVYDMVSYGRYPFTNWLGNLTESDHQIIKTAIDSVGVSHLSSRMIHQLSDGEKQRMMIAKALAQQSDIIILDEPTAHLDLINRVEITQLLSQLAIQENKAVLIATHELDLALQSADKIWLMNGNDITVSTPEDLVISGEIQKVFASKTIIFDHKAGSFKISPNLNRTIGFENLNNTIEEIWTQKALERWGYEIVPKSEINLQWNIETNSWNLEKEGGTSQSFESIEALGKAINNSNYE